MKRKGSFTVSGPDVEKTGYESDGVGLSAAITFASSAASSQREATYYVRDALDKVVGRTESDGRNVFVYDRRLLDAMGVAA